MSGLVGYGSSSSEDEDEDDAPPIAGSSSKALLQDRANSADGHVQATSSPSDAFLKQTDNLPAFLGPKPEPAPDPDEAATPSFVDDSANTANPYETDREAILRLTAPNVSIDAIPPSPPGSPDPAANARFARFLELKGKGIHFNEDLAKKPNYLNPSLFSTMLRRAGLDESAQYASSLPSDLWNPMEFPEYAYHEQLGKDQQAIRSKDEETKRAQSAAGKRVLEFIPQTNSTTSSRKSTPSKDGGILSMEHHTVKKKKI